MTFVSTDYLCFARLSWQGLSNYYFWDFWGFSRPNPKFPAVSLFQRMITTVISDVMKSGINFSHRKLRLRWHCTVLTLHRYLPRTQTSISRAERRKRASPVSPAVCTLPMVPCSSSPVARLYLAKNEAPEEEAASVPYRTGPSFHIWEECYRRDFCNGDWLSSDESHIGYVFTLTGRIYTRDELSV